eukprot:2234203-Rhodomonas_salina.2
MPRLSRCVALPSPFHSSPLLSSPLHSPSTSITSESDASPHPLAVQLTVPLPSPPSPPASPTGSPPPLLPNHTPRLSRCVAGAGAPGCCHWVRGSGLCKWTAVLHTMAGMASALSKVPPSLPHPRVLLPLTPAPSHSKRAFHSTEWA